jgi:hypothetical protein
MILRWEIYDGLTWNNNCIKIYFFAGVGFTGSRSRIGGSRISWHLIPS